MVQTPNIIDAGDVLIVGAGLAGLFTALKLAHRQVTVMAADKPKKTARVHGRKAASPPLWEKTTMQIYILLTP